VVLGLLQLHELVPPGQAIEKTSLVSVTVFFLFLKSFQEREERVRDRDRDQEPEQELARPDDGVRRRARRLTPGRWTMCAALWAELIYAPNTFR